MFITGGGRDDPDMKPHKGKDNMNSTKLAFDAFDIGRNGALECRCMKIEPSSQGRALWL